MKRSTIYCCFSRLDRAMSRRAQRRRRRERSEREKPIEREREAPGERGTALLRRLPVDSGSLHRTDVLRAVARSSFQRRCVRESFRKSTRQSSDFVLHTAFFVFPKRKKRAVCSSSFVCVSGKSVDSAWQTWAKNRSV